MLRLVSAVFAAALLTAPVGCDSKSELTQEEQDAKFERELEDASARVRNNKLADAQKILTRLLEQRPDHPTATALLGNVHYQQGDYAKAESLLTAAAAKQPEDANTHFLLGEVLRHAERPAEAATSYRKAFDLDAEKSEYGMPLGEALMAADQAAEAEPVLRAVLDLDPQALNENGVGVNTLLGDALRAQDKLDDALNAYMKAQTTYQSDKMARAGAAFVYEAKKDIKHALDEWSAYIQRDCCSEYSRTVAQKKMTELELPADAAG